jgi:hypothetical protein
MSYILKPQKYNIKTIQELGLTDADFTDAVATDTVPNIRTIASQNIQKITDKMLLPQFYDKELKTEVLKAEFPKLYNSLMFCFIPTLGTTATPTLTIKQGTKNTKVFEVALFTNNGNKYNKIYNDFLFYNSATAPYLEKPEMFQGNIDWRSLWTSTQDAEATTKTFAEICGDMNVMAKEYGRGVVFRQLCTSGTNPNMFRAIREYLGSTSGGFRIYCNKYDTTDASAPMYIEIWTTGNEYYKLTSTLVSGVYQLFNVTNPAKYKNGAVGLATYTGYTQNITVPNVWTDFAPTKGTATIVSANTDTDVNVGLIGNNSTSGQLFVFKEYIHQKQTNIHSFVFNVDYSGSGITGSDTQAIDFRVVSIASGSTVAVGDINMFGRLITKVIDKSAVFETISDTASISEGYKIQIRSSIAGTTTPIILSVTRVRLTAVGK